MGPEGARPILRQRLERREADFLALAGCEYGDLERIVGQEGVKGALHTLYRQGVYLILGEFKVRRAVVREWAATETPGVWTERLRLIHQAKQEFQARMEC